MLFLMFPTSVIRSELIFLHLLSSQRNFLSRDSDSTFAIAHKHFERREDCAGNDAQNILGSQKWDSMDSK